METRPIKITSQSQGRKWVVCDGGAGELGHPKVYLPFGNKSEVICYYCGRRFEKKSDS